MSVFSLLWPSTRPCGSSPPAAKHTNTSLTYSSHKWKCVCVWLVRSRVSVHAVRPSSPRNKILIVAIRSQDWNTRQESDSGELARTYSAHTSSAPLSHVELQRHKPLWWDVDTCVGTPPPMRPPNPRCSYLGLMPNTSMCISPHILLCSYKNPSSPDVQILCQVHKFDIAT